MITMAFSRIGRRVAVHFGELGGERSNDHENTCGGDYRFGCGERGGRDNLLHLGQQPDGRRDGVGRLLFRFFAGKCTGVEGVSSRVARGKEERGGRRCGPRCVRAGAISLPIAAKGGRWLGRAECIAPGRAAVTPGSAVAHVGGGIGGRADVDRSATRGDRLACRLRRPGSAANRTREALAGRTGRLSRRPQASGSGSLPQLW